jgi:predicted membrane protein
MLISPIIIPGVIGAIFCAYDKAYEANLIWIFSNFIMAVRSYTLGDFTVATSYVIFMFFAIVGVIQHRIRHPKVKQLGSLVNQG